MKKVLFLALALAVGMTGFAQKAVMNKSAKNITVTAQKPSALRVSDGSQVNGQQFNPVQHMVSTNRDYYEAETMVTNYDLQSNSALGNRIATWEDGAASIVATWDFSGNSSFPDRGTGYNFYNPDEESFGEEPEVRQESVKSGWPTITACGDGEILASHATGVNLYYRPTRGEGEWQLIHNWGANYGSPTWPRVVCSGENDKYVHLVMCKQEGNSTIGYTNRIYYVRIEHDGDNWIIPDELEEFPNLDNSADGDYRNQISADDYVMASNGNYVAVMFSGYTYEVFYMISSDNGETWYRQIIAPYPILGDDGNPVHAINFDDYPEGMIDSISTSDNSHSIAIDDHGVVHAAFGLFHWKVADSDSYTYWPVYGFGIVYWNSLYTNPQGGHEIPIFGAFEGDAAHTEWSNNGIGYTLMPDRIYELSQADGNEANLHIMALIDEDGDGYYGGYENSTGATWHYRTFGCASTPGVCVDNLGNVAIIYSVWSETRICEETGFSYRSAYVTLRDSECTWYDDVINLNDDFMHSLQESYPTFAATNGYDGSFWFGYSEDDYQGLFLDIDDENYPNSNMGDLSNNYIYAVKVTPSTDMPGLDTWNVGENEAVNPMTSTRVYPNPTTDVLNIEVNASQPSALNISVFNLMGQKVMEQNTTVNTGINRPTISTSELTSGIYFVTVKANGFENTMKFIVK